MDRLNAASVLAAGGLDPRNLTLLRETGSTNDVAKALAREGAEHGHAVLAERQSAGRGRSGRSFLSPEGGLYLSVILRPDAAPEELMPLTVLLAAAALEPLETVGGVKAGIKWTNDLVVGGRKLAGILTEMAFRKDGRVDYVVCGIGVNCCAGEEDFTPEVRQMATGILMETGKAPDRSALAGRLIRAFLEAAQPENRTRLMEKARIACVTLGKTVRVVRGGEEFIARAESLEDDGALWVTDETGCRRKIFSGEVSVRGMYGYV